MQKIDPRDRRSTGFWKRLPLAGRLLLLFWAISIPALAGFLIYLHSQPVHAPVTTHPVVAAPAPPKQPPAPQPPPVSNTSAPTPAAGRPASPTPAPPAAPPTPDTPAPILPAGKPVLAIVLEGIGYSDALTQSAHSQLPAEIAVGVSPYLGDIQKRIQQAKALKREVYVTLPMQSARPDHADEGPHALGYGNTEAQDQQELNWCLTRAAGATGITDADGNGDDQSDGGYATSPDFPAIASVIANHGFLYLAGSARDGRQTRGMTATHWLNGDVSADALDASLAALMPTPDNPHPHDLIMIAPLTPVAIARLAAWLKGPAASTFTLVAPSALADDGQPSDTAKLPSPLPGSNTP